MTPAEAAAVLAECVCCKERRTIKPGEIGPDEHPMCHSCGSPMIAVRAMSELMRKMFGEYPDGKLNAQDEGALAVAIGHEGGVVKIVFPKPVKWIGFTADQAIEIAELLVQHARACGSKKPLTLKIG